MKNLLLYLIIISSSICYATEQIKDSIIIDGKGYYIQNTFLFEDDLRKYVEDLNILGEDEYTTALWRRYRAVFEITGNQIHLKEIGVLKLDEQDDYFDFKLKSVITDKAKKLVLNKKINNVLVITDDYLEVDRFSGEALNYPNYKIVEIKKGKISKLLSFNYQEFLEFTEFQFSEYKKGNKYKRDLNSCEKNKLESIESYIENKEFDLADSQKKFNCNSFIKKFLF
jgi:hypothetical protein